MTGTPLIRGAVAIFRRDFTKFLSNPFALFMALAMPVMYLLCFGNAVGGTITGLPVGVVQEQPYIGGTPLYESFTANLAQFHTRGDKPALFRVTRYTSEEIARQDLATAKISAVVVIPSDVPPGRDVRAYVDSSEYTYPMLVEGGVRSALAQSGADNPLEIISIYGTIPYVQYFGIGVVVLAIFAATMFGGALALIRDREMGIIEGYFVTPVRRSDIIIGTIASSTVKAYIAGFAILIAALIVTGITFRSPEGFLLVLLVLLLASTGVTGLVVALSSRFKSQQEYGSVLAFFNIFFFITSGIFYPVIGMPFWLQWFTAINPNAYAIHAMRSIMLRGQGLDVIGPDLAALVVFSGVMLLAAIILYRRTIE